MFKHTDSDSYGSWIFGIYLFQTVAHFFIIGPVYKEMTSDGRSVMSWPHPIHDSNPGPFCCEVGELTAQPLLHSWQDNQATSLLCLNTLIANIFQRGWLLSCYPASRFDSLYICVRLHLQKQEWDQFEPFMFKKDQIQSWTSHHKLSLYSLSVK